jgi:hypothetical protein
MRMFTLAMALAGALGLAATATPAQASVFGGLKTTPAVESNTIEARCWHRRARSGWRCTRAHRHHWHGNHGWHRRWESRRHHRGYHHRHHAPSVFRHW